MTVEADHDNRFGLRHRFTLSTSIPKDCTYGSNSNGFWVLND